MINLLTDISERVSVDRDMGSGIRFGAYLIASSLILAYASGGTGPPPKPRSWSSPLDGLCFPLCCFLLRWSGFTYVRPVPLRTTVCRQIYFRQFFGGLFTCLCRYCAFDFSWDSGTYFRRGTPVSGAVLARIPGERYSDYRYEAIFRAYKWDPQVEDHNTVAEHVVLLDSQTARQLEQWAEQLSAETMEIEQAMMERSDLVKKLGLPSKVKKAIPRMGSYSPERHVRLMRFDFHPTTDAAQYQRSTAMFQEVWRKRLYSRESRSRIFRSMNHKAMWPAVCWRHSKREPVPV